MRRAYFIFVAGTQDELAGVKTDLAAWGASAGDWAPFLPALPDSIGLLAQEAASRKRLRLFELSCTEPLAGPLAEAERARSPVVIITDPWSLRLPRYSAVLAAYDSMLLDNCGLLVAWNEMDDETSRERQMLKTTLRDACRRKMRAQLSGHYWSIVDPDEFQRRLVTILDEITLRMLDEATPDNVRRVASPELEEAAAAEGVPTVAPPKLVNVTIGASDVS
jgi:FxsC-like protein